MNGYPVATLDAHMRSMPECLRRLALEVDTLWGDANGRISIEEIDKVARYYLAALPFFVDDAKGLLELADKLGLDQADMQKVPSLVELRCEVLKQDGSAFAHSQKFREVFDEAVAQASVEGRGDLVREALKHSPQWHRLSVLEHSAVAVAAARQLGSVAGLDWQEAAATMLLHDVGKILTRQRRDGGTTESFSFFKHEEIGALWLEDRNIDTEIVFQIRHHLDLRAHDVDELTKLTQTPHRLQTMLIIYLADQVAKGDTPEQLASLAEQKPKIRELAHRCGLDVDALFEHVDKLRAKWFNSPSL